MFLQKSVPKKSKFAESYAQKKLLNTLQNSNNLNCKPRRLSSQSNQKSFNRLSIQIVPIDKKINFRQNIQLIDQQQQQKNPSLLRSKSLSINNFPLLRVNSRNDKISIDNNVGSNTKIKNKIDNINKKEQKEQKVFKKWRQSYYNKAQNFQQNIKTQLYKKLQTGNKKLILNRKNNQCFFSKQKNNKFENFLKQHQKLRQQKNKKTPYLINENGKRNQMRKGMTKKIYSSIRQFNKEQLLWLQHLQKQLSLVETIQQFQKVELNRNIQPSKKLTMRQAYQLKKQIVVQIQNQQSSSIKQNIVKLAEIALDDKQKDKLHMISFFIQIRQKLAVKKQNNFKNKNKVKLQQNQSQQPNNRSFLQKLEEQQNQGRNYNIFFNNKKQFNYNIQIIDLICSQIKNWKPYKFQQPNIMAIKILSILALHILKLKIPIISQEETDLISLIIKLKKKGQKIVDYLDQNQKRSHFECLIYLIFQFYKVVYYLKLDQQLKVDQYNSLNAFLNLYQTKYEFSYENFEESYKISSALQSIKPTSIGLYPYQDSKVRDQIRFKQLQRQLLINQSNEDVINHNNKARNSVKFSRQYDNDFANDSDSNSEQNSPDNIFNNNLTKGILSQFQKKVGDFFSKTSSNKQIKNKSKKNSLIKSNQRKSKKILSLDYQTVKKSKFSFVKDQKLNSKIQVEQQIKHISKFEFPFLFIKNIKIFTGQFCIDILQDGTKINISLKVKKWDESIFLWYKFKNFKNFTQILDISNFQKIIWKIFKKIFITDYMQQQNPFLMKQHMIQKQHIKNYIPQPISAIQYQLIQFIHDYLVYWLKNKRLQYNYNGSTIKYPYYDVDQINKYLQNLQFQRDRKLFTKRYGYMDNLSKGRKRHHDSTLNITYSQINNSFNYHDDRNIYDQSNQATLFYQKNMLFLLRIQFKQILQFKLMKMLFWDYVRQIFIFQLGFQRHSQTTQIQQKIPVLRNIKNCPAILRKKLIHLVQMVLRCKYVKIKNKCYSIFNKQQNQFICSNSQLWYNKKQFNIQQYFQVDLTNQFKFVPVNHNVKFKENMDKKISYFRTFQDQKQQEKQLNIRKIQKQSFSQQNSVHKSSKKHQTLTMFKISHNLFLSIQSNYSWGRRYLTVQKNIQFFQLKKEQNQILDSQYSYQLQKYNLYKIGVFIYQQTQSLPHEFMHYLSVYAKRPYFSKYNNLNLINNINELIQKSEQKLKKDQQQKQPILKSLNIKKTISVKNQMIEITSNNHEKSLNQIYFVGQNIFLKLKYQKIIKNIQINQQKQKIIKFYFLQIYQTFKKIDIQEEKKRFIQRTQLQLVLYQVTNLKNPKKKYYYVDQFSHFASINIQNLKSKIDFKLMTFNRKQMELFQLSIHKMAYSNQFHQKKTKYVQKKVISQANFYFQFNWLKKNQNIIKN